MAHSADRKLVQFNGRMKRTIIGAMIVGFMSWAVLQLLAVNQVQSKTQENKRRIQSIQEDVSSINTAQREKVIPALERIETKVEERED